MTPAQLEFSPFLALLYGISIYAFMFFLSRQLLNLKPIKVAATTNSSRYGSIDGLRGVLAIGVLVHHSFTGYIYFSRNEWVWGSSPILNQMGMTTVALFFMITGFLFTIKAGKPTVDWGRLYISRTARLLPLYFVIVCLVFLAVFFESNWHARETALMLAREFALWVTFACFGNPNVNGYPMTWTMIAGVNWTLRYEIAFYVFAIPVIHILLRHYSIRVMCAGTVVLLAAVLALHASSTIGGANLLYTAHFLAGISIALAFQVPEAKAFFRNGAFKTVATFAIIPLLFMVTNDNTLAVLLTALIFASVVGGASMFGILYSRPAIWLGDISYGIYLIHGLVLWTTFSACRKLIDMNLLGMLPYWLIVLSVAAIVSLLASASYVCIEKPLMQRFGGGTKNN